MPRIKLGETRVAKTWQQVIVDQIKAHRAVPVLGNSIGNDLILGDHRQLILDFAEYAKYPLVDKDNLAHLTQFMTVMETQATGPMSAVVVKQAYLDFAKSRLYDLAETGGVARSLLEEVTTEFDRLDFSELAKRLGYPRFAEAPQDDPLLILASLDLPVYLTTGYHQVMEAALRQAGKRPRTGICLWNKQLEKDIPDDIFAGGYEPSPEEPVVYHLHGLDKYPASLVLTEDDHLEFLVAISQEMGPVVAAFLAASQEKNQPMVEREKSRQRELEATRKLAEVRQRRSWALRVTVVILVVLIVIALFFLRMLKMREKNWNLLTAPSWQGIKTRNQTLPSVCYCP